MNVKNIATYAMWIGIVIVLLVAASSVFGSLVGWIGVVLAIIGWYCRSKKEEADE